MVGWSRESRFNWGGASRIHTHCGRLVLEVQKMEPQPQRSDRSPRNVRETLHSLTLESSTQDLGEKLLELWTEVCVYVYVSLPKGY